MFTLTIMPQSDKDRLALNYRRAWSGLARPAQAVAAETRQWTLSLLDGRSKLGDLEPNLKSCLTSADLDTLSNKSLEFQAVRDSRSLSLSPPEFERSRALAGPGGSLGSLEQRPLGILPQSLSCTPLSYSRDAGRAALAQPRATHRLLLRVRLRRQWRQVLSQRH